MNLIEKKIKSKEVDDLVSKFCIKQEEKEKKKLKEKEKEKEKQIEKEKLKENLQKNALYTGFIIINKAPLFEIVRNTELYQKNSKNCEFRYHFSILHKNELVQKNYSLPLISNMIIKKYEEFKKNPVIGIVDGYYISNDDKFIGIVININGNKYYTTIFDRVTNNLQKNKEKMKNMEAIQINPPINLELESYIKYSDWKEYEETVITEQLKNLLYF